MKDMMNVRDICRITGLTPKLINDYHEEGIVRATAYRSHGWVDREGKEYSGYKVYDEEAVIKLHQVAIFRDLGMKRSEIKKIMTSPDYDSNRVLDEQIEMLKKKKEEIDKKISVAEYIKMIGMKNNALYYSHTPSVDKLMDVTTVIKNSDAFLKIMSYIESVADDADESLNLEIERIVQAFSQITEDEFESAKAIEITKELVQVFMRKLGIVGYIMLYTSVYSVLGDGQMAAEFELTPLEARMLLNYIEKDIIEGRQEFRSLACRYQPVIGNDYNDENVKKMVGEIKDLCGRHFGMTKNTEYEFIMDFYKQGLFTTDSIEETYILNAVKYHVLDT